MSATRIRPPADGSRLRASDSPFEISRDALEPGIAWASIFGREAPVELEIGCGKGWFLTRAAQANPEADYFGIDYSAEHLRRAIDRATKAGLENIRFAKVEAEPMLAEWIPAGSLRAVHIFYPDPWPKKRHHKRRLLGLQKGPTTARDLARVLQPGGHLCVATDHPGYAEVIPVALDASEGFARTDDFYAATHLPHPGDPLTEFERKYRVEGRERFRYSWVRR